MYQPTAQPYMMQQPAVPVATQMVPMTAGAAQNYAVPIARPVAAPVAATINGPVAIRVRPAGFGAGQVQNYQHKTIMSDYLFQCFDEPGLCFQTCLCPCVTYGQTVENLGAGSCILYGCLYLSCFIPSVALILSTGFSFINLSSLLAAPTRVKVMRTFNMHASCFEAFCIHFCCGCCALIQESRAVSTWRMNGQPTG